MKINRLVSVLCLFVASVCGKEHYSSSCEDLQAIRKLTSSYALAVDSKNSSAIAEVFTSNAIFYLSTPPVRLNSSTAIAAFIIKTEGSKISQHAISTQVIDFTGEGKASAITYFTATFLGQGTFTGQIAQSFGKYLDELIDTPSGWKIQNRQLVFFGPPFVGTVAIAE